MPRCGVPIEQGGNAARSRGFRGGSAALLRWLAATVLVAVAAPIVVSVALRPALLDFIGPSALFSAGACLFAVASVVLLFAALKRYPSTTQAAVAEALQAERRRLSRDLHDGLAQDLAVILLYSQQSSAAIGPDHPVSVAARRALAATRGTIADLSAASAPTTAAALRQLATELQGRFGVPVKVHVDGRFDQEDHAVFDSEHREHLVRIAREAIVNAACHAAPTEIALTLDHGIGGIRLSVIDDGRGLSETDGRGPAPATEKASGGTGLPTMRSRAAALGGQFSARARPEGGSEIEVLISVREETETGPPRRWRGRWVGLPRVALSSPRR